MKRKTLNIILLTLASLLLLSYVVLLFTPQAEQIKWHQFGPPILLGALAIYNLKTDKK